MGKGIMEQKWYVYVIVLVIAVAFISPGTLEGLAGSVNLGGAPAGEPGVTAPGTTGYTGAPAVRLVVNDAVLGTSITAIDANMFRQSATSAFFAQTGNQVLSADPTYDVTAGDKYYFEVAPGSTTYYPFKTSIQTATTGGDQIDAETIKTIGTITSTIYNNDEVTENAAAGTEQSVTAGQTVKFKIKLVGATDNAWFGANSVLVCADYNGTAFTTIDMSGISGVAPEAIGIPFGQTSQDTTNNLYQKCWRVPTSFKEYDTEVQLRLTATAGIYDPTNDANINIRIADEYRMQNDFGQYVDVYFDPDTGAVVGGTDTTDMIRIS